MEDDARTPREKALDFLGEGKSVKETADALNVPLSTVYQWRKKETDSPAAVSPPEMEPSKRGRKAKLSTRPISEETAGQLCAGLFAIVAMMDGPEWFLEADERKALGAPLADSMRALPESVATAINTYSAPMVFATSLVAVVNKKWSKRRQRNRMFTAPVKPSAPIRPQGNGVVASPTPKPSDVKPPPQQNGSLPEITDLEQALAAARGSLAHADEAPVGDLFQ